MALHSGHRGYSFAFQHDGTNKGERGKRAEFGSDENTGVFGGEGKVEGFENGGRSDGLFAFPIENTQTMGKTPYVEAGVGIENIFKVLRLDYIWRLTYRDSPGIDRSGLRISLHMTF